MTEREKPREAQIHFNSDGNPVGVLGAWANWANDRPWQTLRMVEAEPVERELARLRAIEALRMSPEDRDALLAEVEREREEMLDLLEACEPQRRSLPIKALLRKHGRLGDGR